MSNLYEINERYSKALALLEDGTFDLETIADTLEAIEGEREEKAKNVAGYIGNLAAQTQAIDQAIKNMTHRKKVLQNKTENLKAYLLANMVAADITKIESPYFAITVKNNPPRMVIDSEIDISSDYYSVRTVEIKEYDKTTMKQDLKNGVDVKGAHLEQGQRVEIK